VQLLSSSPELAACSASPPLPERLNFVLFFSPVLGLEVSCSRLFSLSGSTLLLELLLALRCGPFGLRVQIVFLILKRVMNSYVYPFYPDTFRFISPLPPLLPFRLRERRCLLFPGARERLDQDPPDAMGPRGRSWGLLP